MHPRRLLLLLLLLATAAPALGADANERAGEARASVALIAESTARVVATAVPQPRSVGPAADGPDVVLVDERARAGMGVSALLNGVPTAVPVPTSAGTAGGDALFVDGGGDDTPDIFLDLRAGAGTAESAKSVRLNAGGDRVELAGVVWEGDAGKVVGEGTDIFRIDNASEIALTNFDDLFRVQRYGGGAWGYDFEVARGVYRVTVHFAEIFDGVFNGDVQRVFDVGVGDSEKGFQGVVRGLDVYAMVRDQENTASSKSFINVIVETTLVVRFYEVPGKDTPMVAAVSADWIAELPAKGFGARINVGSAVAAGGGSAFKPDRADWRVGTGMDVVTVEDEADKAALLAQIDGDVLLTQRVAVTGGAIVYEVPVPTDGKWDVTLMWSENFLKAAGKRLFNIAVGDKGSFAKDAQRVSKYDIFTEAGGKRLTLVSRIFADLAIPSGVLRIELESVVENALLNAFVVERPGQQVFISSSSPVFNSEAGGFDHLAHAIAGDDQFRVDYNGKNGCMFPLDASLSHSHFFEQGPPFVAGVIESYEWTNAADSKVVIGSKVALNASLPIGTTDLLLTVTDTSGDVANDTIRLTCSGTTVPGMYGYWYSGVAKTLLKPNGGKFAEDEEMMPQFGERMSALNFTDLDSYPDIPFLDMEWTARFVGNVSVAADASGDHVITVDHGKQTSTMVYVDGAEVSGADTSAGGVVSLSAGRHTVEVLVVKAGSGESVEDVKCKVLFGPRGTARMALGESTATLNAAAIQPTIHSVSPPESTLHAGGVIRVKGAGFLSAEPAIDGASVSFNRLSKSISVLSGIGDLLSVTDNLVEFRAPRHDRSEKLQLNVLTRAGQSNAVDFTYSPDAEEPIEFEQSVLQNPDGSTYKLEYPTSILLGPDMEYYIGTGNGYVLRLRVDIFSLKVVDSCQSAAVGSDRSVLGLAFNPRELLSDGEHPKLYLSTSTLFWKSRQLSGGTDGVGWANGKVQLMESDVGGFCMGVTDDIVSGLPVSSYDHGVNGLQFASNGDLYIAVGSSTNAGVSKVDDSLGGVPDSPLSAAIVIARLSRPNFNGTVLYDQTEDPAMSRIISGDDVAVFASGSRNTFDMCWHSNGGLYATSNSGNAGFGAVSTSCTTERVDDENWPDRIIRVEAGAYYGHPNRNRGRSDPRQCVFYSPDSHPDGIPGVYDKPLAIVQSSTDGILEYTANVFRGSQLRGDLLASKFSVGGLGRVYRMRVNASTGAHESMTPEPLFEASGLSMELAPDGTLLMPQVVQGRVLALVPRESKPVIPHVTSVMPRRAPSLATVYITGYNFPSDLTTLAVLFDGLRATDCKHHGSSGRQMSCTVPKRARLGHASVYLRILPSGVKTTSVGRDFEYI